MTDSRKKQKNADAAGVVVPFLGSPAEKSVSGSRQQQIIDGSSPTTRKQQIQV